MTIGLTRAQILEMLPDLKPNCFYYFCKRAGVKWTHTQPNKFRKHLTEYVYPPDSVEKIKNVMEKK
jgi:hypothetical protein